MRKLLIIAVLIHLGHWAFGGGIITNTNQSAIFARMLSRGASLQIDAVYYNPAGLMKLENGLYLALYNQSIFQTRTLSTEALLNKQEFEGNVTTPFFPNAYAVYKRDALAFSFGFGPVGGGGTAGYDTGLPSFEKMIAGLVPALSYLSEVGYDVTGYDADISFEGSSVMWGFQFGISAKITEMISGYLGLRYIPSAKVYEGNVSNIELMVNGQLENASPFLITAAGSINATAQLADNAAAGLLSLINLGAGNYTLAQVQNAGFITSAQRALLEAGLYSAGYTSAEVAGMTTNEVHGIYSTTAQALFDMAEATGSLAPLTEDFEVDTKSSGGGFLPFIVGVNISPSEQLNIGIKYEHKASITLTNVTSGRDLGQDLLKDGEEISYDMPALLSVGAGYWITDKLYTSATFCTYFDKGIDWGINIYGQEKVIDKNSWDLALGLQYDISDKLALSLGGMRASTGVSEEFQSDLEYCSSSWAGALGLRVHINDNISLDAGAFGSFYADAIKPFPAFNETYTKQTLGFSVGLNFKIL